MEGKLHINTTAVHGGGRKDDCFGAINEPIYMTSNYRIPTDGTPVDWSGIHSNIYQRNRNPNQMVLQDKLCALTGAEDGAVFASGVAALAAVFTTTLNSGDHAIVSEVCYSATNLLFREYLPKKYGVEVTLLDTTDTEAVRAAVRPNTKLIHVETPGNPTTGISGHRTQGRRAAERGRYLCRPHLHPAPEPRRGSGYPQHDQVHQRPR